MTIEVAAFKRKKKNVYYILYKNKNQNRVCTTEREDFTISSSIYNTDCYTHSHYSYYNIISMNAMWFYFLLDKI